MEIFYWDNEWKGLLQAAAIKIHGTKNKSEVIRSVMEEYIACFMTDDELRERRKTQLTAYPPPWLQQAIEAAKHNRKAAHTETARAEGSHGWYRIVDERE